jgi:hypothetical protein
MPSPAWAIEKVGALLGSTRLRVSIDSALFSLSAELIRPMQAGAMDDPLNL